MKISPHCLQKRSRVYIRSDDGSRGIEPYDPEDLLHFASESENAREQLQQSSIAAETTRWRVHGSILKVRKGTRVGLSRKGMHVSGDYNWDGESLTPSIDGTIVAIKRGTEGRIVYVKSDDELRRIGSYATASLVRVMHSSGDAPYRGMLNRGMPIKGCQLDRRSSRTRPTLSPLSILGVAMNVACKINVHQVRNRRLSRFACISLHKGSQLKT